MASGLSDRVLIRSRYRRSISSPIISISSAFPPELHIFHRSDFIYFVYGILIVRCYHLCPVVPISLISIVFFGIMRCRKYHSTLTPQLSNGKRNFGSRTQSIEQIYFNTIRRKNIGSDLGKFAAVVPAIVTDSNLYLG